MIFHPMDFLILIAFLLVIWAQVKVKRNFEKWSKVPVSTGLSGYEIARRILDANGLEHIEIEETKGMLSDHYDPVRKKIRLSESVYHGSSIASASVAAHEVGHAVQHKESYGALSLRHRMFPLANLASGVSPFLLIGGFLFSVTSLIGLGIIFFSVAVLFQLVTLPVEFNASSRAKDYMIAEGIMANEEEKGVSKVLSAAALTYVASTLVALLELIKFVMIFASDD